MERDSNNSGTKVTVKHLAGQLTEVLREQRETRQVITDLRLDLARNYPTRAECANDRDGLKKMLEDKSSELKAKVAKKADAAPFRWGWNAGVTVANVVGWATFIAVMFITR